MAGGRQAGQAGERWTWALVLRMQGGQSEGGGSGLGALKDRAGGGGRQCGKRHRGQPGPVGALKSEAGPA